MSQCGSTRSCQRLTERLTFFTITCPLGQLDRDRAVRLSGLRVGAPPRLRARATVCVGLIGIRPGAGFSESIRLGKAAERVCRRARRNDGGEVGGRQRNIADEADRELGGWCRPERQESGQRGEGGGGGGIALGTVEGSRGLGRRAAAGLASGSPPSVQRPGELDGGWVGSCPGLSLRGSRGVCVSKAAGLQDSVRSGGRGKTAATGFGVG